MQIAQARQPRLATGAAATGHGLALVGFVQPWVVGQFGGRDRLSGLDLTRLAGELLTNGLAGQILALPISRIVLLLVPLAAVAALALLAATRIGVLDHHRAHRIAVLLAVPIALVALVSLLLFLLPISDDSVLNRPDFGLVIVIVGATLTLGSASLTRSHATN